MAMKLVEIFKKAKFIKIFKNVILINNESKRLYYKKIINYFFSIFSLLFFFKEILGIVGIAEYSFNKPIVMLNAIILIVLIISIIMSYFDFKKYYKKKYKIDEEKYIEIRVGDYIENSRQLIKEDNRNNLENKAFFIFGTNNAFRFDVVLTGSLQYDFITEFLTLDNNIYQSMIDNFLNNSKIEAIDVQEVAFKNQEYFLYDLGTICEIKFPLTEPQMEDRFSLLLFADSKITDDANFVGDRRTLKNIKNIWKYMRLKKYTNRRILIPLLGTGCSNSITYRESIAAIIDAFFDDINNHSVPSFKEIIISIHPDRVGNDIDLLEIERYIQFKKNYR